MSLPVEEHTRPPATDDRDLHDDHDAGPPPVQFRIKSLLWLTTVAALLCAVLSRVNNAWAAVLIWVSLLIAGHVVGNAMGTRAAARVSGRPPRRAEQVISTTPLDLRTVAAPTTTLGRQAGLGFKLFILVGFGGLVGSMVGTTLVWIHNDRQLSGAALGLAAFSSAVLGAFVTFLAASCFQVWAKALHAASRHGNDD